jgi:hypothetical protein
VIDADEFERAHYHPEDECFLVEEDTVKHFQVVSEIPPIGS